jgi:GMP synthase (glutamine-hydrolysing)
MRAVLIMQHDAQRPPGLIGEYLREARFELDVRRLDRGDPLPDGDELTGFAALVALGGALSADDETDGPSLAGERELLVAALDHEVPTLGVDLGARQLVAAGGGDVYARAGMCLGWQPIEFSARDAFVWDIHPRPLVFSWRSHTCRLPDRALPLADTDAEPQIFRFGDVAWGLQFHPEVDRRVLDGWFDAETGLIDETYPGGTKALRKMSRRELLRSAMLCGQLMANFLAAGRVRER